MDDSGWIRCRFPDESRELRLLGQHFQNLQSLRFSPHFLIAEENNCPNHHIKVSKEIISAMIVESTFNIEKLTIPLSSKLVKIIISLCLTKDGEAFPVSGFPRCLATEEKIEATSPPRSMDLSLAAEEASSKSENKSGTRKQNVLNTFSLTTDSPHSPNLNLPGQVSSASKPATPETPVKETSSPRDLFRRKSLKRLGKTFAELADTSISNIESLADSSSENPKSASIGGVFRRSNGSPTTPLKETDERSFGSFLRNNKGSRLSESSCSNFTEDRTADTVMSTPTSGKEQKASESWPYLIHRRPHAAGESTSPTRKAGERELCDSRKNLRKLRCQSLQNPPSSVSSKPSPSPIPTPNRLTGAQDRNSLEDPYWDQGIGQTSPQYELLLGKGDEDLTAPELQPLRVIQGYNSPGVVADRMADSPHSRRAPSRSQTEGTVTQKDALENRTLAPQHSRSHSDSRLDERDPITYSISPADMTEEEMIEKATVDSMKSYCQRAFIKVE
jgi:hypothetical protein